MFDRIAHRYDLLNRLLSLGRDVAWRKRVSKYLPNRPDLSVLDLATGTADLLISIHDHSGRVAAGVGIDMAGKMLDIARTKISGRKLQHTLSVVHGDATRLPFKDGSFDAVTIAFGIRNFTDVPAGLEEMLRVLKDDSKALILEFSLPGNWFVRKLYLFYFRYILPLIGSIISGDSYAYRYLNRTVETFAYGSEFCDMMREAGFTDVAAHRLTFGIATVYEGTRRAPGIEQAVASMRQEIERSLSTASDRVTRIEVDIPRISPLEWLSSQTASTKFYWRDREGDLEIAAVGMVDLIDPSRATTLSEGMNLIASSLKTGDDNVRYFGGCRFNVSSEISPEWRAFGAYQFVLPRFELVRQADRTYIACNLLPERDTNSRTAILERLTSLADNHTANETERPSTTTRTDVPDYDTWAESIKSALGSIAEDKYEKIVLARKTTLEYDHVVSPMKVILKLREQSSGCYLFYFQPASDVAFMGCTPERLYRRSGKSLTTEAIAGTRRRGDTEVEDAALGKELKTSEKDVWEHRLVVKSIKESLRPLVAADVSEDGRAESLVKLDKVQHLITGLTASLTDDATDAALLDAMHPTAAVGGFPKEAAVGEIEKLERFDRGWYAAPIGWLSRDDSQFVVAIRSALLDKESLNVYAGAGIVQGSDAQSEWEEVENKMSGFMKAVM